MNCLYNINKKILIIRILIIISVIPQSFYAQRNKRIPPEEPRLIVGIVVNQMRYDYIFRYWDKYGSDGFKRLINEGTFCKNANYNYMFTQTGPGHATIFTGTSPSQHGIIADRWYVRLKEKIINCAEDENVYAVGGNNESGQLSPRNLLSSTLGDEIRLSTNFKSKVFGVSMEGVNAVLSSGHTANAAYWYSSESGNWITSSYYRDSLPDWVKEFNNKKIPDIYLNREWSTLLPIGEYSESLPDSNKYEVGFNGQVIFPYNLNLLSTVDRTKRNYEILKSTPLGNTYIKDFAISTIVNEELGMDEYPDMIMIGFASTGYIGQKFGPNSVEVEDTYLRLDKDIAHLLEFIDDYIGKENVVVFLTADHGVAHVPKYLTDLNIPAGYFNQNASVSLLRSYLNAIYGQGDWVKFYFAQGLYLDHNLIEDSNLSLEEVQDKVSQFFIQFSGVANSVSGSTLQTTNFTSGILEKIQNCYNQDRSGDVIINLEPGWVEVSEYSTANNTAYSYDTHVPLIWYGWKINRSTVSRPLNIIDIAPTISTFLNISFPNAASGSPIIEIIE